MANIAHASHDSYTAEFQGYLAQVSGESIDISSGGAIHRYKLLVGRVSGRIDELIDIGAISNDRVFQDFEEYLQGPLALPSTTIDEIIPHFRGVLEKVLELLSLEPVSS